MKREDMRPFHEDELLGQIGTMNVFAISGGRVNVWRESSGEGTLELELPVSAGYRVRVYLAWNDTYTVERVLVRKGKVTKRRTVEGVYCDQVGEVAYLASCYKSHPEFGTLEAVGA